MALRLWLGFPKSLDISKAIDKKLGAEREVVEVRKRSGNPVNTFGGGTLNHRPYQDRQREQYGHLVDIITAPATPEAQQWDGWGTALKPANEPILLARKPISEKTIAENVLKWGTGGLNIDGCRIPMLVGEDTRRNSRGGENGLVGSNTFKIRERRADEKPLPSGRFPANVILDEEAGKLLDEQHKGASRFFYCAKASKKERGEGNNHPTVKPIALMEYLIKLVTPPEGIVLDPFLGSGTTAIACINTGRNYIGFELDKQYYDIANVRIRKAISEHYQSDYIKK